MTPEHPSETAAQILATASGDVCIIDEGKGFPLLAIHGLPGSVRDYRWLAPVLAPHMRVIRMDMPGFADTPLATQPDPAPAARAQSALDVADALGIERFVVMGHSMGGPVAMALAALHPERIAGLVLLGSVGQRPHRFLRNNPDLRKLTALLKWIPGAKALLLPIIKKGFVKAGFSAKLSKAECHHSIRCVAATSFVSIRSWIAAICAAEIPVAVGWAEDDRLIESTIFQELADACPAGPRMRFLTGGHNIQKTQAIEIGEALSGWVPTLQ